MRASTVFISLANLAQAFGAPSTCLLSPLIAIKAGEKLVTGIENTISGPCELTLLFSDEDFMPVTFAFQPITCFASQSAEIVIPLEVPNGSATFLWQCAGQQATGCIKVSLEGGSANFNLLKAQQTGDVSCFMPIATSTSLLSITQQSRTLVSTMVTTRFATETDSTTTSSSSDSSDSSSGITQLGPGNASTTEATTESYASASTSSTDTPPLSITRTSISTTTGWIDSSSTDIPLLYSETLQSSSTTTESAASSDTSIHLSLFKASDAPATLESSLETTSSIASITIVTEQAPPETAACTMKH